MVIMTERIVLLVFSLLIAAMTTFAFSQEKNRLDLEAFRWKNRLILAFAPSDAHPGYQALKREIQAQQAEVVDRDLLFIHVMGGGEVRLGENRWEKQAERLREKFSIRPEEFVVILIGKDGGVKLRQEDRADLGEIFALIDTMPMRRREMQEKRRR